MGVKRAKYQLKPFYSSNLINFCLSLPAALNEDSTEVATHHEILKSLNICCEFKAEPIMDRRLNKVLADKVIFPCHFVSLKPFLEVILECHLLSP